MPLLLLWVCILSRIYKMEQLYRRNCFRESTCPSACAWHNHVSDYCTVCRKTGHRITENMETIYDLLQYRSDYCSHHACGSWYPPGSEFKYQQGIICQYFRYCRNRTYPAGNWSLPAACYHSKIHSGMIVVSMIIFFFSVVQ